MAVMILVLIIACGAIAAGYRYVDVARRMRSFQTVKGRVTGRGIAVIPGGTGREGRWGKGGRYGPKITYTYVVDGVSHISDRWSDAGNGLKRSVAEQQAAAVPDQVDVFYDPGAPDQAYLHIQTPRLGYALMAGGASGVAIAIAMLL